MPNCWSFMCSKLLPNYCWKFYFLIMGREGAIQTLLENLEPWTPTISCPNQTQGKNAQDLGSFNLQSKRDSERARFLGGMCVHVYMWYIYIYIYMYCIWLCIYNYIYYMCVTVHMGSRAWAFVALPKWLPFLWTRPGCKKPHVLDILGNACCSTCQRTRSQLCLMMMPHKQRLKNANENFKQKKWSFKTSINSLQFWQLYNFTGFFFPENRVVSVFTFQSISSKSPPPCRYGANRPGPNPQKKIDPEFEGGGTRGVPTVLGSGNRLYFCIQIS